jgi:hypothetical protein
MQILFISDEVQIINFLSGLQAEAIMPKGNVEVAGVAENSAVTVICSGESLHYPGTIVSIDSTYSTSSDGKWLALKFIVRRTGASIPLVPSQDRRPADA